MGHRQRTPKVDFDDIPGDLPDASVPDDVDLHCTAQNAVIELNALRTDSLAPSAIWRDLLALSDSYRTFYSANKVFHVLRHLSVQKQRSLFRLKPGREPRIGRSANGSSWLDIDVVFTAQHGFLARNCMGTVSIMHDPNADCWRIWMLRTWLECFDGHGHPDVIEPLHKRTEDPNGKRTSFQSSDAGDPAHCENEEFGAIIVGGGQAGLAVGGRLHALGVPYIVLENHANVGDVWAERYESLRFHTSKEYGNLPFGRTYLDSDDKLLPAKQIGAGHKSWAERYGINILTGTAVESAKWSNISRIWTVTASRANETIVLKTKNLVLSIGTGHATPIYPVWATAEKVKSSGFQGTIVHSFAGYRSAHQWAGQRGIVVGTANTAHDVAEDMANAKMETTMIQRNSTFVFPCEWLIAAEDVHYHADMHPATADRECFTYPNKIMRQLVNHAVHNGIAANPERFDALEKAGFQLDRLGDIYNNLYVRFGGHYVDIGCSARIAKGEIKVKAGRVKELTQDGLRLENGQEIGADLIVLCTGFDHDFRNDAARLVGWDVADQIDDFWGMNQEGEIRGHARPSGHPHLYYHGGDVRMARFFSQFIALQIQADVLGSPMQPYLES